MARLFDNFIEGTLSAELLTAGTSISGDFLASLSAVASPDTVTLVLDPEGAGNGPELVTVTAHTAAATTATVTRAQEGTSAVDHASGTKAALVISSAFLDDIETAVKHVLAPDMLRVDLTANETIVQSAGLVAIDWDQEAVTNGDGGTTDGVDWAVGNPSRLTVYKAGVWEFVFQLDGTGYADSDFVWVAQIRKNGTVVAQDGWDAVGTSDGHVLKFTDKVAANDYFEVFLSQSDTTNKDLDWDGNPGPYFQATRLGGSG